MKLDQLRIRIDTLDKQLLQVLQKRMEIVMQIGQIKKQRKMPTENRRREKEIKENVQSISEELKLDKRFTNKIFNEILRESRRVQK